MAVIQEAIDGGTSQAIQVPIRYEVVNGLTGPFSPSLERINPLLGYVHDNVLVECWAFNVARSTFEIEDVIRVAQSIVASQERLRDIYHPFPLAKAAERSDF